MALTIGRRIEAKRKEADSLSRGHAGLLFRP